MSQASPPPWLADPCPQNWVKLSAAANFYFLKTPRAVRLMIEKGRLDMPSYFDGTRWFIRLPYVVSSGKSGKRGIVRRTAA